MARKQVWLILIATAVALSLLIAVLAIFEGTSAQTEGAQEGWTPIFIDTFEGLSPVWAISNTTQDTYHWDVVSHAPGEYGLWAAGGGSIGGAQTWPTGTYTHAMTTWAIAGPFVPEQRHWEARLTLTLQNQIAAGDALFVGLSDDGVNFQGITLTEAIITWTQVSWATEAFSQSSSLWIGLGFTSDSNAVDSGPLIDHVHLELNYGYATYLPMIRFHPTPTPLPPYVDEFDDPESGWFVGDAMRFNDWCRYDGMCNKGWEAVASFSYTSVSSYRMVIPLSWHGGEGTVDTWFVWPAEMAPMPEVYYPLPNHYCIETQAKFLNAYQPYEPWWANWGLVFAANAERTEVYTFRINANYDVSITHFQNYIYPGNRQPLNGDPINVEHQIIPWAHAGQEIIANPGYNHIKVEVQRPYVSVYVNGRFLYMAYVRDLPRDNVGLIGGTWEMTPVDMIFEYFLYDPGCASTP